ncbi:MAG: NADP-dependent oxidoreductase [Planctomycetes bacterium]|nr:NADP-dependent oxidoreductase [Planctomycetota bacterium]
MKATAQKTMRAAAIHQFGGIDEIHVENVPVPEIDADEILIRVQAAGVGVWDPFEREGGFAEMLGEEPAFPYVLGSDGAGVVEAVGEAVTKFKVGDQVYGMLLAGPKGGFYAEYAAVNEDDAALIPEGLTIEQAGVMGVDAITALRGLDDVLELRPGEAVIIFGASGGIGHLAVQLAKRMNARVFAVASGDDGVALARQLGADAAVDGHREDVPDAAWGFEPDGFDAALLTCGGDVVEQTLFAMRKGGRVAYPNGVDPVPDVPEGVYLQGYDGMPDPEAIEKLNSLIEAGPFDVHVARVYPLDRAADAHRALKEHFLGKIVLRPG